MLSKLKKIFILLLLFCLVLWGFWDLTKTFYQQDEWYGLGDILTYGNSSILLNTNPLQIIFGQGRIFADALVYFLIGNFPFSIIPVSLFAIFFHLFNTILVFVLTKKIIKKDFPSVLASLFFAFNGVAAGAVIWSASGTGTLPATSLILIGLFCFLRFIETDKTKWLLWLFLSVYLSLYFKEIGIFLFIFLPAFHLIFLKYPIKKFIYKYSAFIAFFLISVIMTVIQFQSIPIEKDLFITGATQNLGLTTITRGIMYPLTSFSLILIPAEAFFDFAKQLTWVYYPFFPPSIYDLVAQSVVLDGLAVFLSLVIFYILYMFFKKSNDKKYVIFLVGFIIFSFLPYIIIGKSGAYLESRYYYLAAAGWGVLGGLLIKNSKFLMCLFAILILMHVVVIKKDIQKQIYLAKERIDILYGISKIKPLLDNKNIFFVSGDRNFYVGEGNPMPWQQGLGYTLLVWYYGQNKAPEELRSLISKQYLWGIGEEGYKETSGVGFGYFWNKSKLKEAINVNNLRGEDITSLYYDSNLKLLRKIDYEIQ